MIMKAAKIVMRMGERLDDDDDDDDDLSDYRHRTDIRARIFTAFTQPNNLGIRTQDTIQNLLFSQLIYIRSTFFS